MTGSGTKIDPYIITTAADLDLVRNNINEGIYYELGADIDLSSYPSWIPIATSSEFKGHFDGKNFTIRNMNITSAFHDSSFGAYVGLFGIIGISLFTTVTQSYSVRNLVLESCSINLNNWRISNSGPYSADINKLYVGILAGEWRDTTFPDDKQDWNVIQNIRVKNSIINIVKNNLTGSLTESVSNIYVGGLIGYSQYGLVTSCSVDDIKITGIVSSSFTGNNTNTYINGLSFGINQATYNSVKNSYINFEYKIGSPSYNQHSGRLYLSAFGMGLSDAEVHDNYVYNTIVSGTTNATCSGFASYVYVDEEAFGDSGHDFPSGRHYTNATFGNTPTASVFLFTAGYQKYSNSSSLYNYVKSGSHIYNINPVTPTGMPTIVELTETQMKNSSSYSGFNFTNVWKISPESQSGYPYFSWETVEYTPISNPILVKLEYSTDSGSTWYTIVDDLEIQEGTGSFSWYAPETQSSNYLVRISSSSYYDTSDSTFTVNSPTQPTYSFTIGGIIQSASGYILPSVDIQFTNGAILDYYNPLTGEYQSNIITSSYSGLIIPTASNYIFNPVSRSYNNLTQSLTAEDFTAIYSPLILVNYSITGSVYVSGTITPIQGATVVFSGSSIPFTTKITDINGKYSASFIQGSEIFYSASHPLYQNTDGIKHISNLNSNITNDIFNLKKITYLVSGSIKSGSTFLQNIEITVASGNIDYAIYTNANGQYSASFDTASNIILTPYHPTYSFMPSNIVINNLNSDLYNKNFEAYVPLPTNVGLALYYDSRKAYNTSSNTLIDLSTGVLPNYDMPVYNAIYYTSSGDLRFGASFQGASSASFYGIQISSSFAIEFLTLPSFQLSQAIKTLISTEKDTYPYLNAYITNNKIVVEYKFNILETNSTIISSSNIADKKFNHIVIFTSESKLFVWANGKCESSASITASAFNGGIIGIQRQSNNNPYAGYINVIKIYNGSSFNLNEINSYYLTKNYWKDLKSLIIPENL